MFITFNRPKGAKDKKKRKRRRNLLMGGLATGATLGLGALVLKNKRKINLKNPTEAANNIRENIDNTDKDLFRLKELAERGNISALHKLQKKYNPDYNLSKKDLAKNKIDTRRDAISYLLRDEFRGYMNKTQEEALKGLEQNKKAGIWVRNAQAYVAGINRRDRTYELFNKKNKKNRYKKNEYKNYNNLIKRKVKKVRENREKTLRDLNNIYSGYDNKDQKVLSRGLYTSATYNISLNNYADFRKSKGAKDKKKRKPRVVGVNKLRQKGNKTVKYNNNTYKIGKPELSNRGSKKYKVQVENTNTGQKKTVHWGATGYSDYLQHKDKARRKRFQSRHGAIKLKDGSIAANNPMQPAYYATKYNW